ncbi:transporter [Hyphomicrobium sp.]|uniref:transporter n=1 Tax=Hyphomicrobium sp. TaxID=82 RepID=UPI003F70E5AE
MYIAAASALLLASAGPAVATDKRAYTIFNPTPDSLLRDMNTDRPDKTESPYTVDAGRFQIETDLVTYTYNSDAGVTTRAVDILPFNFKIGLTHDTDVQIVYGAFSSTRTSGNGATDTDSGFGDVTIRLKHNLWGNDGGTTALGIMPVIKIPTNTLAGLNNDVEGGVIVPLAVDLGQGVGLGLMTEIDILKNSTGGYDPTFVNSATLSFEITKQLGLYVEAFVERSTESGAETVVTIDSGVTFAVTDNLQLDAGANIGVTDAADDLNVFVGLSRRY